MPAFKFFCIALILIALVTSVPVLACRDINRALRRRRHWPFLSDSQYYDQIDHPSAPSIVLSMASIFLFLVALIAGGIFASGRNPSFLTVLSDVTVAVCGLALCFYARRNAVGFSLLLSWVPLLIWCFILFVLLFGSTIELPTPSD